MITCTGAAGRAGGARQERLLEHRADEKDEAEGDVARLRAVGDASPTQEVKRDPQSHRNTPLLHTSRTSQIKSVTRSSDPSCNRMAET